MAQNQKAAGLLLEDKFLTIPGLTLLDACILSLINTEGKLDSNQTAARRLLCDRHAVAASIRRLVKKGLIVDSGPGQTLRDRAFVLARQPPP